MDTGPILAQRSVPIRERTSAEVLSDQLAYRARMVEILPAYLRGTLAAIPQDTPKILCPKAEQTGRALDFGLMDKPY